MREIKITPPNQQINKKGAPTNEVTTPIGTSVTVPKLRTMVSHRTKNTPVEHDGK